MDLSPWRFPCETLVYSGIMDDVMGALEEGHLPTMAGTKYVLTELNYFDMGMKETVDCVSKIIEAGYIPILAHVERYSNVLKDIENVKLLKDMGAKVQINLYSFESESNDITCIWARKLLDEQLVDFIGTDAHGINKRPPRIFNGVKKLYDCYPEDYVDDILYGNVERMILGGV